MRPASRRRIKQYRLSSNGPKLSTRRLQEDTRIVSIRLSVAVMASTKASNMYVAQSKSAKDARRLGHANAAFRIGTKHCLYTPADSKVVD